jgi:hypothetical protein
LGVENCLEYDAWCMEWKKKEKEKLLSIRDLALGACSQVTNRLASVGNIHLQHNARRGGDGPEQRGTRSFGNMFQRLPAFRCFISGSGASEVCKVILYVYTSFFYHKFPLFYMCQT